MFKNLRRFFPVNGNVVDTHVVQADSVRLVLGCSLACVPLPLPGERASGLTAQDRHARSQGVISGGLQTC